MSKIVPETSSSNTSVSSADNGTGGKVKNKADPRSKERQIRFTEERKFIYQYEAHYFDMMALLVMIISVLGVTMNWKSLGWLALILSVQNITNFKPCNDPKQIFSSLMICIAAIWMLYARDPTPLFE